MSDDDNETGAPVIDAANAPTSAEIEGSAPTDKRALKLPRPGFSNEDGPFTSVDPAYTTLIRVRWSLLAVLPLAGVLYLDITYSPLPGVAFGICLLVAAFLIWRYSYRRYRARGYILSEDYLRSARGVFFRVDTVVPFTRVQHIDVDQGPLERAFGLAHLILYTAGSHNSAVALRGLRLETANTIRQSVRDRIERPEV